MANGNWRSECVLRIKSARITASGCTEHFVNGQNVGLLNAEYSQKAVNTTVTVTATSTATVTAAAAAAAAEAMRKQIQISKVVKLPRAREMFINVLHVYR